MCATSCPNCGGIIVGDGYTVVLHCERVDAPFDMEPDATPVYCDMTAEAETKPRIERQSDEGNPTTIV